MRAKVAARRMRARNGRRGMGTRGANEGSEWCRTWANEEMRIELDWIESD